METLMMNKMINKKERFKIYFYKNFQAVEDVRGNFRVIEKIGDSNWKIYAFKSKPKVLQEYRLLSKEEMPWEQFFKGYRLHYVPTRKLNDAKTPQERAEIWQELREKIEGFESQGYELIKMESDDHFELTIPLKVFDFIDSEDIRRLEFEEKRKKFNYRKNVGDMRHLA